MAIDIRAAIKGCNPQHLLQLSMLAFPLMLLKKLPVVERIHPQSMEYGKHQ